MQEKENSLLIIKTTKMNIYKIFMILVIATIFCSCSNEDDITAEMDPPKFEVKDSDDPVEHYIYEYYQKHKSFILFDYNENDYKWNLTHNSDFEVTLPKKEIISDGLEYAKKVFLEVYPDDFISKYFPYKLLMAEKVSTFDYMTGMDLELMAASGMSCVVISGVKEGIKDFTEEEMTDAKAQINAAFWSDYMINNGLVKIPDDFYNVSKDFYSRPVVAAEGYPLKMDAKKEDYGFVFSTISPWNGYEYLPDSTKDLSSFFEYLFAHTSAEINTLSEQYPRIKQKFDILLKAVKNSCNIDLSKIND